MSKKAKPPLGSGERFKAIAKKVMGEPGYSKEEANAVAAHIGMMKYGKAKMAKMAAAGRKKA
jgi:hypothetical protein